MVKRRVMDDVYGSKWPETLEGSIASTPRRGRCRDSWWDVKVWGARAQNQKWPSERDRDVNVGRRTTVSGRRCTGFLLDFFTASQTPKHHACTRISGGLATWLLGDDGRTDGNFATAAWLMMIDLRTRGLLCRVVSTRSSGKATPMCAQKEHALIDDRSSVTSERVNCFARLPLAVVPKIDRGIEPSS
jgi:hypothetical protein